jgi:hypothetical protein
MGGVIYTTSCKQVCFTYRAADLERIQEKAEAKSGWSIQGNGPRLVVSSHQKLPEK